MAVASPGTLSTRSKNGTRYCGPNCGSLIGRCRHSRCFEATAEERGAGNPHATFCGNRRRVTASGDRGAATPSGSWRNCLLLRCTGASSFSAGSRWQSSASHCKSLTASRSFAPATRTSSVSNRLNDLTLADPVSHLDLPVSPGFRSGFREYRQIAVKPTSN